MLAIFFTAINPFLDKNRTLPFLSKIPFVPNVGTPYYQITYTYHAICLAISGFCASSNDGCLLIFINHFCAELDIVIKSLKLLDDELINNKGNAKQCKLLLLNIHELFYESLRNIKLCNQVFALTLLYQSCTSFGLLCFTIYLWQIGHMHPSVITICLSAIIQLFMYSAYGNQIIVKTSDVANAVYCTKWYKMSYRDKKSLQIMMMMAQQSYTIKATFFTLSLENFISMIKAAFSYAAILKTFYNK